MHESRIGPFLVGLALCVTAGVVACSTETPEPGGADTASETAAASEAAVAGQPAPADDVDARDRVADMAQSAAAEPAGEGDAPERGEEEHSAQEAGEEHGDEEHAGEYGDEEHAGEHDGSEEGEEPGVYIARDASWDMTRRGARLILTLDSTTNAFTGRLENVSEAPLCGVRIEIHLSSGTELGPTARSNIAPGVSIPVELSAGTALVESWTAHPESSACGEST